MKNFALLLVHFIFSCGLAVDGIAQTAELRGYVRSNTSDENISIASVSILNASQEVLFTTKTDYKFGEYRIDSIPHGTYTLLISANGFKTKKITDFSIRADHKLVKNVELLPEFSRFSKKKEEAPIESDYKEKDRMIQYVMYSGLAVVLFAVLGLQ